MARRSFRRCIKLLTPKPSSRSSSVSPSKTWKMLERTCYYNSCLEAWDETHAECSWRYLSALDIFRAGAYVHRHCHDNLQPGLNGASPPLRHGRHPGQLHLLEAIQLVLWPVWQAEAGGAVEAVWVWVGEGMRFRWVMWVKVLSGSRGGSEFSEQW